MIAIAGCAGPSDEGSDRSPIPGPNSPTTAAPPARSQATKPLEEPAIPDLDICVQTADLLDAGDWQPSDVEGSYGDTLVEFDENALVAVQGDQRWLVFKEESGSATTGDSLYQGPVLLNDKWLVFRTVASHEWGAPWQLHAWDSRRPGETSWAIARQDVPETAGFPLEQLRRDRVAWSQSTDDGQRAIMVYDLAARQETQVARGRVYAPVFVNDDVLVWQEESAAGVVGVVGRNLATGQPWDEENPITRRDGNGGQLATDGRYWVLANAPSSDGEESLYVTWVWIEGQAEPARLLQLAQPVYVPITDAMVDGFFAFISYSKGVHIADLSTGDIYQVWPEWADIAISGTEVRLRRAPKTAEADPLVASFALDDLESDGQCGDLITE